MVIGVVDPRVRVLLLRLITRLFFGLDLTRCLFLRCVGSTFADSAETEPGGVSGIDRDSGVRGGCPAGFDINMEFS